MSASSIQIARGSGFIPFKNKRNHIPKYIFHIYSKRSLVIPQKNHACFPSLYKITSVIISAILVDATYKVYFCFLKERSELFYFFPVYFVTAHFFYILGGFVLEHNEKKITCGAHVLTTQLRWQQL